MGLFSKKKKEVTYPEFEYNKEALSKKIYKSRSDLYADRNSESHKNFVHFIEKLRNLEILTLAAEKDLSAESHSYHRGRLDALNNIISMRDNFISEIKHKRAQENTKGAEKNSKRSYLSKPRHAQQAGLSI